MFIDLKFRHTFKFIVLITLGHFLLIVGYSFLFTEPTGYHSHLRFFAWNQIIVLASLWWAIAELSGKRTEAMVGLGVALVFVIIPNHLFGKHYVLLLVKSYLGLFLPYLVFGVLVFRDQRAAWMLLVGVLHLSIEVLVGSNHASLYNWLNTALKFFGYHLPSYQGFWLYLDAAIELLAHLPFLFFGFAYFYKLLEINQLPQFFEASRVNLANTYSKRMATCIYLLLNGWITVLAFGLLTKIRGGATLWLLRIDYVFVTLILLATLYFVSLVFRNFLVEYSLQTNRKPGWAYFFWHLPIIGIIGWFVHLSGNKNTFTERVSLFKAHQGQSNKSIKVFMIVLVSLRVLLLFTTDINSEDAAYLFFGEILASIVLTVWFVERPQAIWWILGLLGFITGYIFVINQKTEVGYIYYAIPNVIVLYPLFHAHQLEDMSETAEAVLEKPLLDASDSEE